MNWPGELATEKRREYSEYIRSARWRNIRADIIRLRGSRCERCGLQTVPRGLEVHHRTYERLGRENPSDLEVLCPPCHTRADEERSATKAREIRVKAKRTRYSNGLDTYARKKYGDYWPPHVEEEFDEWLERKADR